VICNIMNFGTLAVRIPRVWDPLKRKAHRTADSVRQGCGPQKAMNPSHTYQRRRKGKQEVGAPT
jgi:hypothetical protein